MTYKFIAQILNERNGELVAQVSGSSEESLEEEMGKSKWTKAIKEYEAEEGTDHYEETTFAIEMNNQSLTS
jgi:hypothetical protein